MSAILLDYTFQMLTPFLDTVINETRQYAPLIHYCLFHLFQFQTVIAIHSLLQGSNTA